MSTLDAVLAYKARKEAQEALDVQAIPTAIATYSAAKESARKSALDELQLRVSGAAHGLSVDPRTGVIAKDTSLQSPLEQLIEKGKAAEAAKTLGDRGMYDSILGKSPSALPEGSPEVPSALSGMVAPEIDPFTGKPTSKGLQQEQQNKLIALEQEQNVKKKVPTAQQKQDLTEAQGAESMLNQMKVDADKLPAGYGAIWQNIANFFTRGETNPGLVTYNDTRPAAAVGLYRTLTGDKRLSDADAKARALPLMWDSDEGESVREKKFAKLARMAKARLALVSKGQYTVDENGQYITPLADLEAAADNIDATQTEELPEGVTEDDIAFTMKKHKLSREEVLERLNA